MAKPYSIFKLHNGIYYAQVRLPDGTRANKKSTGCYTRAEAEKVVMGWIVNSSIPQRSNGKQQDEIPVETISLFNNLRTFEFSENDIKTIIDILMQRKFICSAVIASTAESIPICDYLEEFWNEEKSPYIREKRLKGQSIHKHHIANQIGRIRKYWLPRLEGKTVGELTRDDVNAIYGSSEFENLSPKSANEIVAAITLPMKWAYLHKMTNNNCYDGIIKRANKTKKRKVLTYEETKALFEADWENDSAKLACLLACCTGMRRGEIAALQLQDIGKDRIYIRHAWEVYDEIKETKTDEEREFIIPPQLRDMLLSQAYLNPHNEGLKGYVFFGLKPSKPTDPGNWLKYMRRALASIGYNNPSEVCFHSFRHEWCTTALSEIGDKRICMIGSGHKTDSVFATYSAHVEKEKALQRIAKETEKIYLPIIEGAEKVEFTVIDDRENQLSEIAVA